MKSAPFLLLLLLAFCSPAPQRIDPLLAKPENSWIFEGWACAPDHERFKMGQSPLDYCDMEKQDRLNFLYYIVTFEADDSPDPKRFVQNCLESARSKIPGAGLVEYIAKQCDETCTPDLACGFRGLKAKIGRRDVYGCCPVELERGFCQRHASETCLCIIAMEFPEGRESFNDRALR